MSAPETAEQRLSVYWSEPGLSVDLTVTVPEGVDFPSIQSVVDGVQAVVQEHHVMEGDRG